MDTKLNPEFDGFPAFYISELLFHNLGRFTKRHHPPSNSDWLQELFGKPYQYAVTDLATNLDFLTRRIPKVFGFSSDYVINWHTVAPYYRLARSHEQVEQLDIAMKGQNSANVHVYLGLSNTDVGRPEFLRKCDKCVDTDRSLHGAAYLHREHQLAGIDICPIHQIQLSDTRCPSKRLNAFTTLEDILSTDKLPKLETEAPDGRLVKVALDAYYLLNHPELRIDRNRMHHLYRVIGIERGFTGKSGNLNIQAVAEHVRDYYSPKLLEELNLPFNQTKNKSWVYELLANSKLSRPTIKHLLIIQALGYSVEELSQIEITTHTPHNPFGGGPWVCLNKICTNYNQAVISHCQISKIGNRVRGEFRCNCGFTYSLTELEGGNPNPRNFKIHENYSFRVLHYGYEWDTKLRQLWNDKSIDLKQMGRILGVSPATVKAQTSRLSLSFPPAGSPFARPPQNNEYRANRDLRSEYHSTWENTRDKYPSASISELQRMLPKEFSWLTLYDQGWLNINKPQPHAPSKPRTNWEQLDKELAAQVKSVAKIRCADLTSPRITAPLLSQDLGFQKSYLRTRLSKLPQTKLVLDQYLESYSQHAIRRLDLLRTRCIEHKIVPTASQLRKQVGICDRLSESPMVKKRIEDIALELSTRKLEG